MSEPKNYIIQRIPFLFLITRQSLFLIHITIISWSLLVRSFLIRHRVMDLYDFWNRSTLGRRVKSFDALFVKTKKKKK